MSSSSFSIVRHHRDGSLVLVSLFRQYIYLSSYLSFYLFLVRLSIIVPFLFIFSLKPTTPTDTDTDNHIQKTNPLSASSLSGEHRSLHFSIGKFFHVSDRHCPSCHCLLVWFFFSFLRFLIGNAPTEKVWRHRCVTVGRSRKAKWRQEGGGHRRIIDVTQAGPYHAPREARTGQTDATVICRLVNSSRNLGRLPTHDTSTKKTFSFFYSCFSFPFYYDLLSLFCLLVFFSSFSIFHLCFLSFSMAVITKLLSNWNWQPRSGCLCWKMQGVVRQNPRKSYFLESQPPSLLVFDTDNTPFP